MDDYRLAADRMSWAERMYKKGHISKAAFESEQVSLARAGFQRSNSKYMRLQKDVSKDSGKKPHGVNSRYSFRPSTTRTCHPSNATPRCRCYVRFVTNTATSDLTVTYNATCSSATADIEKPSYPWVISPANASKPTSATSTSTSPTGATADPLPGRHLDQLELSAGPNSLRPRMNP